MTIDFSQYYDNTDLSVSGGAATAIANGMQVKPTNMRVVANNNNWMWARRVGPVAQAVFGDGPRGKSTADGTQYEGEYEDTAVLYLPADRSQRAYKIHIFCEHTGGASTADANIRLKIGGSTVATIAVAQGSGTSEISQEIANPTTAGAGLVVQLDSYHLRLWSVAVTRKRYDNTTGHADAAMAHPFFFMQPGRVATNQPLTDEWINRGLNNCKNIVDTERFTLGCVSMPIKTETTVVSDALTEYEQDDQYPFASIGQVDAAGNQSHVAAIPITVRYAQTVSLYTFFRAPAGTTCRIELSPNATASIAPNTATLPATDTVYTFTETQVALTRGAYHVRVYFDHTGTTEEKARLYSMSVVSGPETGGL